MGLRPLLSLASIPYGVVVRFRNRRFDLGRAETHGIDIPVICVGNLTVGGTGKTPMVAYLCRWFRERDIRVGIVSRGYRAEEGKQNDEARELSWLLPDVPHVQNPDRVAAAMVVAEELEMQVVVLDDGFQHRRLARDVDIVLLDALEPFGYQRLLPRGLLREPLESLQRAHLIGLTRANLISRTQRDQIRARVAQLAPRSKWMELEHKPTRLLAANQTEPLDSVRGKRVLAFCGLGNPTGFRRTLDTCETEVVGFLEFPDHHEYNHEDIETICRSIREHQPDYVICTHKDMVKVEIDQLEGTPLRALLVEQQVVSGQQDLERILRSL